LFEQDRTDGGEQRWQAIGLAGGMVLLLVAHTVREEGPDEIVRLISAAGPTERSEAAMTKLVRKTLADNPMTPARRRKLARLAAQPDSAIDYSDILP